MRGDQVSSMERKLTQSEEKEVISYFKNNPEAEIESIRDHFTKKFGIYITSFCIQRLMVQAAMGE